MTRKITQPHGRATPQHAFKQSHTYHDSSANDTYIVEVEHAATGIVCFELVIDGIHHDVYETLDGAKKAATRMSGVTWP